MYNTKSELKVNYGLWMVMMCPYKFINCNKCANLLWDVANEEAVGVWGQGVNVWELSVFSLSFGCELKTSLKTKVCLIFLKWQLNEMHDLGLTLFIIGTDKQLIGTTN